MTHLWLLCRLRVCDLLPYLSCVVGDGGCQTGILTRENSGGTKSQPLTEVNGTR
jgi:hypothetical protein